MRTPAGETRGTAVTRSVDNLSVYQLDMQANLLAFQWDHCLSTLLIRSTLGASFGVIFSVLLFKRRAWPAFVGFGFGAGRAWEECDSVCRLLPSSPHERVQGC
jgi:hypothetical protein